MRYVADSFAWQTKDWLDQPLHFAGGAGGVMLIMLLCRAWWMALLAFSFVVAAGAGAGFATHVMLI